MRRFENPRHLCNCSLRDTCKILEIPILQRLENYKGVDELIYLINSPEALFEIRFKYLNLEIPRSLSLKA